LNDQGSLFESVRATTMNYYSGMGRFVFPKLWW